jgi:hypothetical protein
MGFGAFLVAMGVVGSMICANTIGTVRVACNNAVTTGTPLARMTSGASATDSAAYLRLRSASTAPQW